MQVSVCIINRNAGDALLRCLRSIEQHGASVQHEAIVVDNASSDGSADRAERALGLAHIVRNSDNYGFAAAANQAARLASGQVLLMLRPECEIMPGALNHLWRFLHERPWIGACGPQVLDVGKRPVLCCRRFPSLWTTVYEALGVAPFFPDTGLVGKTPITGPKAQASAVDWISGPALAIHRRAWDMVGPLDESFWLYAAELDWLKRLRRTRLECWYVPEALVVHHRDWSRPNPDPVGLLWFRWSLWRYFAKHHGSGYAAAARLLTALGEVPRVLGWTLASALPAFRERSALLADLHLRLLTQSVTGAQPPPPEGLL